jgi:phospholipase A1
MTPAILALIMFLSGIFWAPLSRAYPEEVARIPNTFSYYKPVYFIAGKPDTKIELSIKMQAITNVPLYLGYTQLMMWDLRKPSDPMRDINYAPEMFYRMNLDVADSKKSVEWLDFGILEHESNGRDSWESRSWNRSYLRYFKQFSVGQVKLGASIRGWIPYGFDETSEQLPQYYGVYEAVFSISHFLGGYMSFSDLTFRVHGGGASYLNPTKGGQEITLRLKFNGQHFLPSIVAQYFQGYGENLLDADRRLTAWRVGIGF